MSYAETEWNNDVIVLCYLCWNNDDELYEDDIVTGKKKE